MKNDKKKWELHKVEFKSVPSYSECEPICTVEPLISYVKGASHRWFSPVIYVRWGGCHLQNMDFDLSSKYELDDGIKDLRAFKKIIDKALSGYTYSNFDDRGIAKRIIDVMEYPQYMGDKKGEEAEKPRVVAEINKVAELEYAARCKYVAEEMQRRSKALENEKAATH